MGWLLPARSQLCSVNSEQKHTLLLPPPSSQELAILIRQLDAGGGRLRGAPHFDFAFDAAEDNYGSGIINLYCGEHALAVVVAACDLEEPARAAWAFLHSFSELVEDENATALPEESFWVAVLTPGEPLVVSAPDLRAIRRFLCALPFALHARAQARAGEQPWI